MTGSAASSRRSRRKISKASSIACAQKIPPPKIVLAGMQMPPSLGADYTRDFAAVYPELAEKNH